MEMQAVVLAAGRGSRMTDLTSSTPKALLPVANMPMIWYPVKMLQNAGFEEVIIIVQKSQQASIQAALESLCQGIIRLEFVSIPAAEDWGTAESLRFIKDKIKRDVLVVSCDVITDLPLHRLADLHRTQDASLTMLLTPMPRVADISAPGGKAGKKIEKDVVGLDNSNRVVLFSSEADFEDAITVRKSLLKRHPCINMHTGLMDAHIYLMKKWVYDLLLHERTLTTVKGELLPYLVKKQFMSSRKAKEEIPPTNSSVIVTGSEPSDILSLIAEDYLMDIAREKSSVGVSCKSIASQEKVRCFAYVMKEGLCLRANTIITYCEANRNVPPKLATFAEDQDVSFIHSSVQKAQKSTIGSDCMLGEGCTLGEKSSIKNCTIVGRNCKIADKVKLSNCILMDNVTVNEGANLNNCIVCESVNLGQKCELKDCLVGKCQDILDMAKFNNDVILDVGHMMEI